MQKSHTIENRGWAGLFTVVGGDEVEVHDPTLLAQADGHEIDDEEIAVYLQDGDAAQRQLYEAGVRGGRMSLVFDREAGRLHCRILYTSPRDLSEFEKRELRRYSDEQLVDGAGSSPVRVPAIGYAYFVHLGNE